MFLNAQHTLVCALALALSLACARVETPPAGGGGATAAAVEAGDAFVLSADDQSDGALAVTRRMDAEGRGGGGELPRLSAQEHMRRAAIYHANRAFEEARAHWRAVIERHPSDANVPAAHFGTGRSLFQERRYEEALPVFQKLGETYIQTPAGREGFYYVAATLLRMDRPGEAAARYAEYAERFPDGERVENAYLNVIDSLREAGRAEEALPWITRTRARFPGTATDTNALFARLRLEISRSEWAAAVRTAAELSRARFTREVNTNASEVAYLRAYALERSGQREQAVRAYQSIADSVGSYFGGRATARLRMLGGQAKTSAAAREARVLAEVRRAAGGYPAPNREALLRATAGRAVDPRFMLAITRQESGFRADAKSPAGARGLMQLVPDVAAKYAQPAGVTNLREDDLYRPEVNIRLASVYLDELFKMFPGLPEAAAASYNGGEDSVARWVRRSVHDDPGVFTAEVGFTETKDYVHKVMANYRAYQMLYTADLKPRK
ncbi:MAG TPA: transglycosylase SLT domain-containing protein [Pyrinomonadaceae bacterium]|nr:transglycosylase SLT domain-containing protein [Pyrinomonadaceae bacterium]